MQYFPTAGEIPIHVTATQNPFIENAMLCSCKRSVLAEEEPLKLHAALTLRILSNDGPRINTVLELHRALQQHSPPTLEFPFSAKMRSKST
jgi:hypothetical protein